jgi:hypothetical protein
MYSKGVGCNLRSERPAVVCSILHNALHALNLSQTNYYPRFEPHAQTETENPLL